jgi:hypothetical protein
LDSLKGNRTDSAHNTRHTPGVRWIARDVMHMRHTKSLEKIVQTKSPTKPDGFGRTRSLAF